MFSDPQYTWPLSRSTQNLKTLSLIGAEKSVTENLIGEKEKWTNKGNDKQEEADSLLHNIPSYTKFQNPPSIVPEKSLTKKKVYTHTHTHTHIVTEKKKKLYTPYILRILRV